MCCVSNSVALTPAVEVRDNHCFILSLTCPAVHELVQDDEQKEFNNDRDVIKLPVILRVERERRKKDPSFFLSLLKPTYSP